ncbi:hypothetical protein HMN09_00650100 [Mycena chlorophos]|uniref:Uncharacterized protein n=1 Tax=Mycena chlorophos TaxID=658473 RepID=A0A8H6T4U9_MYCCL|nr:hypothetical protein HMN09_00650100 [Mycena chlorophos]
MSWAFNFRTPDYDSDDSDDDQQQPAPASDDTKLLQDIDLGLREEAVVYRPNPFSIAKQNAACRTNRVQSVPEKAAPSKAPPKKPTGRIVDCFMAQKPAASGKKPSAALEKRNAPPKSIPRPTTLPSPKFPGHDANASLPAQAAPDETTNAHISTLVDAQSVIAAVDASPRPSSRPKTPLPPVQPAPQCPAPLTSANSPQITDASNYPIPRATLVPRRPVLPQTFSSPSKFPESFLQDAPSSLSSPALTSNSTVLDNFMNRPPKPRNLSSRLRQIPRVKPPAIQPTPPSFPHPQLLAPQSQRPPASSPGQQPMLPSVLSHATQSQRPSMWVPGPRTAFQQPVPPSDRSVHATHTPVPPQAIEHSSVTAVSSIASRATSVPSRRFEPPIPASPTYLPNSSPIQTPSPSPPPRIRKAAPPPKAPLRPVKRQRSDDAYNFDPQDPDQQWSTLPSRKAAARPAIQTTKAFRMPLLAPAKFRGGRTTGISASSSKRVITFLPPPMNSAKVVRISHHMTQITRPTNEQPRLLVATLPNGLASVPLHPTPQPTIPLLRTPRHLPVLMHSSPTSMHSPPTSDPITEFPEPSKHIEMPLLSRRYARVKSGMKYRRKAEGMWTLLDLPSCGQVYEDKDNDGQCQENWELPVFVW